MTALTDAIREAYTVNSRTLALVVTLDFGLTPALRLAACQGGLIATPTAGGPLTFEAAAFQLKPPPQDFEGGTPEMNAALSDPDGAYEDAFASALDASEQIPVVTRFYLVDADSADPGAQLAATDPFIEFSLAVTGLSFTGGTLSVVASLNDSTNRAFPGRIYEADEFPMLQLPL